MGSTMRNIRQNLFFAFIYNVVGVSIAAGALYPFFGLLLGPLSGCESARADIHPTESVLYRGFIG
jgi:hypothetical protein